MQSSRCLWTSGGICCMLQNELWPTLLSDSVGSIMSVPETGQDMVGAWKP